MAQQILGLDMGPRQLKMVHICDGSLCKAVSAPMPEGLVQEDGLILSMEDMAQFLRRTADQHQIPRVPVALTLPASLVYTRRVTLPYMTLRQLRYNLPFEFREDLTLDRDQYFFDFAVLEHRSEQKEMELYACAARKDTVKDYRTMLRRAGFSLKAVLPEQWAYGCFLRSSQLWEAPICLVEPGFRETKLFVFCHGRPDTSRTLDLGFDHLGEAAEPEGLALYHQLGVELLKTVNFYNYNHRSGRLDRVLLCGDWASDTQLCQYLHQNTGLQISQEALPELTEAYFKAYGCAIAAGR